MTFVLVLVLATTGIASAGMQWGDPHNPGGQHFDAPTHAAVHDPDHPAIVSELDSRDDPPGHNK